MAPQLQFETVQMALACARSITTQGDHYVCLRALDFVPPTLFANPLFLHLEKGIERGLIRVETNANKDDIHWPCWENNQYRQLLENIWSISVINHGDTAKSHLHSTVIVITLVAYELTANLKTKDRHVF